jgi:hypothetical protein
MGVGRSRRAHAIIVPAGGSGTNHALVNDGNRVGAMPKVVHFS